MYETQNHYAMKWILIVPTRLFGYNKHMNTTSLPEASCLVYARPDHTIAVATRRNGEKIGLTGGKGDPGETPAETAARESDEEAGIVVDAAELIEIYAGVCEPETPGGQAYYCRTYLAFAPQDAKLLQKESGIRVGWASFPELLENGTFVEYNKKVEAAYWAFINSYTPSL